MMSCLGGSRSYTIPHISRPPTNLSQTSDAKSIVSSSPAVASDPKNNISSQSFLPRESLRKPRTRRGRPHDSYTKSIAAFYTFYPKIFSEQDEVCPLVKIEPRSPAEQTELLQELPALISRLRQVEHEVPILLSNLRHGDSDSNSASNSPSPPSQSKPMVDSAGLDDGSQEYVVPDECCDVESFLDSNNNLSDIDGGMKSILGDAGDSASEAHPLCVFGVYGNRDLYDGNGYRTYFSAIRALRRGNDGLGEGMVSSHMAPLGMRLADKMKAEREMNAMSFCSLDWLKRDESQHKLSLKLDYEEVINAWSGRGSLYIDEQSPQTVPDEDDDESASDAIASVDIGLVPNLSFWRFGDENVISNYTVEDMSSAVEDGMETKNGIREARVLRYKEKRQTRLFSKKIRYEVRKLNAERRPRMKGRFVKRPPDLSADPSSSYF
uniref:CONSTANS-LIKE 16 n=1 Tax=Ginkgo biloba TaxID=3311 RepID=A0A248Y4Q8_GINBI|nr:CONSTANS-LIKE 16 [Ginkgo biloba]